MNYQPSQGLQQFKNLVGIKFQLYNSLFTSLPFHRIEKTGILLSLLLTICEEGYKKKQSPQQILEEFFTKQTLLGGEREKADVLFRFVQYVERQIVLFDALEDAAFRHVNDMSGAGTLKNLLSEVIRSDKEEELTEKLKDYSVWMVLTAHPTQFYPGPVLGIINDLSRAVIENNAGEINLYLQQLGKTPFLKKQKPTPYDEAVSLIWYLENVFYQASGRIISAMRDQFPHALDKDNAVIKMGFWPGGDRDGNPFVRAETTLRVAESLRGAIIRCYYFDVRRLKRRLTFKGVDVLIAELEQKLYNNIFIPNQRTDLSKEEILDQLTQIKEIIIYQHNGLFVHMVDNLIGKVMIFGLHFATLDIRQESTVHGNVLAAIASSEEGLLPANYASLSVTRKIEVLTSAVSGVAEPSLYADDLIRDTLETVGAIRTIQQLNGEEGCSRYIISQCSSALNVLEVMGILRLGGWKNESLTLDIVPLFETVDDLQDAAAVMKELYEHPVYNKHLQQRGNTQTIMLGFSDGTKDGGYLMANWAIYKAKEQLTAVSLANGIDVVFFDGRGGPPARGGGKTHKFYASMGKNIANKQIQLTIQGQTVSSNFGTIDTAQFNIEQLINAGISNDLFSSKEVTLQADEEELLQALSVESYKAYTKLKEHPYFLQYLNEVSPLRFYNETNIASRPSKRKSSGRLELKDLRAIPYVGAWSQLKQNVTGYYGVGKALHTLDKQGRLGAVRELYKNSPFFRTLLDNCEMAMKKCFFPLTEHFSRHPVYGELWTMIYDEFELTQKYIFKLSGKSELMADYPVEQLSIQMRERIVLPLSTIQQYALLKFQELEKSGGDKPMKEVYERLIMRSSFGIINAARNSA
jgi:phosphoenolpyruvate carboxylase